MWSSIRKHFNNGKYQTIKRNGDEKYFCTSVLENDADRKNRLVLLIHSLTLDLF